MLPPVKVMYDPGGMLIGTMDHGEVEFMAVLIIRYHHLISPDAWIPVSRAALATMLQHDDECKKWAENPFWRPSPYELQEKGYITGWGEDPQALGILTDKFHEALAARHKRLNPDVTPIA